MNKRIFCLLMLTALACGDTELALVPDINIEPGTIEFREGSNNNTSSVTIENLGRRPLQMRNFRLENQSGDGTLSATLSGDGVRVVLNQGEAANDELIELEPAESIQLNVTYEGNFIEPELGRVTLQTNDPDEGNVSIPILAGAGGPAIIVSPGTLNFDTVEVGSERNEDVVVVNSGLRPLELSRLSVEGSNDFRVSRIVRTDRDSETEGEVLFDGNDSEISYPVSIAPGDSVLVTVTFAPTTTLPNVTGELLIESNAENVRNTEEDLSTVRVNLLANGARACLIASPEVLDFGSAIRVESQDVETPNQRLLSIEHINYTSSAVLFFFLNSVICNLGCLNRRFIGFDRCLGS